MSLQESLFPKTADAVVIGGGSTGANIAYHLTRLGITDVVLLERGPLASGVTGRSGAQLIPRSEHPVVAKLKWEGVQFYTHFEEKNGTSVDFRPIGYLAVAHQHEQKAFEADLRSMTALGSRAALVKQEEAEKICPGVQLLDDEIALTIPEAGYTDPVAAVRNVLAAAQAAGARVFEYSPASIRITGDSVAGVATPQGVIATKAVIVAANVWTNELLNPVGAGLPLSWHRAEVCFYRRPSDLGDHSIVGDFIHSFYFRPEIGGLTMAGSIPKMTTGVSTPQNLEGVDHPDLMRDRVKPETIQTLLKKLTARIPRFAEGYWRRGHSCVYDVSPDWHPILSLEQSARGLFAAAGFSGHGFVMSTSAGRIVAESVAGLQTSLVERHLFRPQRFAENEPVKFEIG